jgi:hypothetical protein
VVGKRVNASWAVRTCQVEIQFRSYKKTKHWYKSDGKIDFFGLSYADGKCLFSTIFPIKTSLLSSCPDQASCPLRHLPNQILVEFMIWCCAQKSSHVLVLRPNPLLDLGSCIESIVFLR